MIKTLRHCCHNCHYFREGFTMCYDEFYECRKGKECGYAEETLEPNKCSDFAINTDNDNLIFDEEDDDE